MPFSELPGVLLPASMVTKSDSTPENVPLVSITYSTVNVLQMQQDLPATSN